VQALCAAPMFTARWRWSAGIALALPRFRGGRKVPAPLARMAAEDLLAAVFPDPLACAENLAGELEIPDHPLVQQAIRDCLTEAMDIEGFEALLRDIERGAVAVAARDLTEPSPLALEVLSARPYAYLDDAPLEERRTQAVMSRRWLDPQGADDLGALDPAAIERVREEAWPEAADADELHDALGWLTFLTEAELAARPAWQPLAASLAASARAARVRAGPVTLWVATERLPILTALLPHAEVSPRVRPPAEFAREWAADEALLEIVRGRLQGLGPITSGALASSIGLPAARIEAALAALQAEGSAMHGRFTAQAPAQGEWCERGLLARIHRYTVKRLRAEIEPVEPRELLRFLCEWQRVAPQARMEGPDAVAAVLAQLEGFESAAAAWETEILPARINEYETAWLDEQCLAGRFAWMRLTRRRADSGSTAGPVRSTPVSLLARRHFRAWASLTGAPAEQGASASARRVLEHLGRHGASFFDEILEATGLLPSQAEDALGELVGLGMVNSDSFGGLRALLVPSDLRRSSGATRHRRRQALFGMDSAGRWSLARRDSRAGEARPDAETVELVARTLLKRWGVVLWRLLAREVQWLPPWRDLLSCYRRLEARGEIRGGRFVAGLSGEQFAAPEAVGLLREVRRREPDGEFVSLSAADPLNLLGILTPGARVPALVGNRVLYRDGTPLAVLAGGEVRFLVKLAPADEWQARIALLRRHVPASLASLD
jgi:ATP-dependent Lhr-like helicase